MDPIHQFNILKIYVLGHIGGYEISITNSALFMFAAVFIIIGGMLAATARRSLVPGRAQAVVETTYEFVAGMVRQSAGEAGMKFFPSIRRKVDHRRRPIVLKARTKAVLLDRDLPDHGAPVLFPARVFCTVCSGKRIKWVSRQASCARLEVESARGCGDKKDPWRHV